MMFSRVICGSGGLWIHFCWLIIETRSGGLYDIQEGYMLFRGVVWMFRRVICCSGGLYEILQNQYKTLQP